MKKKLFILAILVSASAQSFECSQNEAQFIGKIREARIMRIDQGVRDCFYKIDFSYFQQHALCPLDFSLANTNEIIDFDCSKNLDVGQEVSGILVEKNDVLFIEE